MTSKKTEVGVADAEAFPVLIDEPAGPYNLYQQSPRGGQFELAHVEGGVEPQMVECGRLDAALDPDGEALHVLVPVRVATFPGCRVMVRLVARASGGGPAVLIGVPVADPFFSDVTGMSSLPEPYRTAVAGRSPGMDWEDSARANDAAREGHRRWRLVKTESEKTARKTHAWRTGAPAPPNEADAAEPFYSVAERAVPLLPLRFQEYIARELLDDERILMFIHRPASRSGGRRLSLLRPRLPAAILVITDRQVMVMTDVLDPGHNFTAWGYVAQVSAIERVTGTSVRIDGGLSQLEIRFGAAHGIRTEAATFPAEDEQALRDAAELLAGFVPAPGTRALRRVYDIGPFAGGKPPGWAVEALEADEPVAWVESRARSRLAISRRSVALQRRGEAGVATASIADVALLELTLALTLRGCRLAISPAAGPDLAIDFEYSQASEFLSAFTILRQLLGQPSGRSRDEPGKHAPK